MKGQKKVVDVLNDVLSAELVGINQYFLHAKMCKNWGFHRIAELIHHESIDEMKHASELVERILFLEGVPNLQKLGRVRVGQTVPEQFKLDLDLEVQAVARLNKAIALCVAEGDNASRDLLEGILTNEESHLDWLETQLGLVKQLGEKAYLAEQLHK
ncbi:MAG TPA: bacterioferritin [Candidatus Eisenbacteria bacterium]|nr:bacterioferritin [Candidatus Eisenbacteria bacterium]